MNQDLQNTFGLADDYAVIRHRVLRNTYWLLALSMIPTVVGAWLGMQMHFSLGRGWVGPLLFIAIAYGFFIAIEKTKNSGWGVAILLGFTFFMGLMLSRLLSVYLAAFTNGPQLIATAFGGTAAIFGVMATIATVSKRDFSGMGKWLFASLILIMLASIANIFLGLSAMSLAISFICVGVFSAYILYDVQQVINGGETNYVIATLQIYLDIYNVFVSLLRILSYFFGDRR